MLQHFVVVVVVVVISVAINSMVSLDLLSSVGLFHVNILVFLICCEFIITVFHIFLIQSSNQIKAFFF